MTMPMIAGAANIDLCQGAPTLSNVTANDDGLGTCLGAAWQRHGTCSLNGALGTQWEIYWELREDRGSWVYYDRTTGTTAATKTDTDIGSDDQGNGQTTKYWQCRAYIVPIGASPPDECSGPTASSELSKLGYNCFA